VSNWLKQFTQATLAPLVQLNHDLVVETLGAWRLPRLTIDVDGTVVCTGAQVQWAFRGFNSHHRKHLSYYPLLAHVAQTGHILRVKNRPGNVNDLQAVAFVRELIDSVRVGLGRALPARMMPRFQREILRLLAARGCAYAIKATRGAAPTTGRRATRLDAPGPGRHRVRASADDPAVGRYRAHDDLSEARPPRVPEELPARSLHPG
jgi:hypothetical protein